ncbi:fuculose phosphate aldolase [Dolosigranulum pigrum]|jgi:L-fuculose phosphate aldolase|uniref:L-ribulose-5-phosphate 4-epimerase n=2 Tax=Dolosigranulum TaxID=29393 RepID=H3NGE5_9LACT|nr:L-ribulose-5-phosphate 4-epimerase [Dolosigranulum pigrum ATCC 51524]QJS95866.1 L-fuculose-phosphate aldolase [Dolosigranulum pigrum]QJS97302.1 L-fuculose-phosphate aldolase [Dolosigranulum pigrum]QTJ33583.1 L-fuculose-phosphate aldolase [Dolosigranulum pigrum]QTJ36980.1 L-fuculose-phosphate aldolase [Dolosigranulum pigrum]
MLMKEARDQLIAYGKKLVETNLTKGTGGNLSIFDREAGHMAITPSGIDFFEIQPEDIVIMTLDGDIVEGERTPSSEWVMHKIFYENREDIDAMIHAHTMYATVMATLRWDLPPSHYMVAVAGKNVRVADYATYGTPELAENAYEAMKDRRAVLLANHGIIAGAQDLLNAFNIVEEVEYCSEVHIKAKSVGEPVILDDAEMTHMLERFETYGQRKAKD